MRNLNLILWFLEPKKKNCWINAQETDFKKLDFKNLEFLREIDFKKLGFILAVSSFYGYLKWWLW